jgi:drug/metabolite transporter (DMT)-like permease
MPIVSTLWGVVDGESFLISYAIWIVIILAGVYLANRSVKRAKRNPELEKYGAR